MRFCYPSVSGADVWLLPGFNAWHLGDCSTANEVFSTTDVRNRCCDDACEDDEERERGTNGRRDVASQKNCTNGVQLAVFLPPNAKSGGA